MKSQLLPRLITLLNTPVSNPFVSKRHTKTLSRQSYSNGSPSGVLDQSKRDRAARWQGLALKVQVEGEQLQCSARTEPCRDFNGDFYGIQEQTPGRHAFYVGDVSGKGLPAAFYQSACLMLVRQATQAGRHPTRVIQGLNEVLSSREDDDRFATLLYGIADTVNHTVTIVSAGHHKPMVISARGDIRELDCPLGMPVGLSDEYRYQAKTFSIDPSDTMLIYSDGLVEARNESGEFLGELGLMKVVNRHSRRSLPELTKRVMRDIEYFSPQRSDDRTLLALKLAP